VLFLFAQCTPNLPDGLFDCVLVPLPSPNGIEELLLRDNDSSFPSQEHQSFEWGGGKVDALGGTIQSAALGIDREVFKLDVGLVSEFRGWHGQAPLASFQNFSAPFFAQFVVFSCTLFPTA
jgi:hypothetical protein